jgi:hypothetical protein
MANLVISGDSSGSITLAAPAVSGTTVLTLPTTSGTLVTTAGGSTVPFALGSAAAPSITFTGDTNTGIFSPGADIIAFSEGGVESMRINSSGDVSIGTTNAFGKFNVSGGTGTGVLGYFASSNANLTGCAFRSDPTNNTIMLSSEWNTTATNLLLGIGGTERLRINPAGNVIVGSTVDAGGKFQVANLSSTGLVALFTGDNNNGNSDGIVVTYNSAGVANYRVQLGITDYNGFMNMRDGSNNQTVRISAFGDSYFTGGNLMVGGTSALGRVAITSVGGSTSSNLFINNFGDAIGYGALFRVSPSAAGGSGRIFFENGSNTNVGQIVIQTAATAYITTSDYRLKENVAPMSGALAKVAALKPVTYKWKVDGSSGQGFIAHELQAVVPDAVVGEKDAVDKDGKPVYQGVDTSFLVATLTAAIQEQQALITQLQADVAALKGKA